MNNPFLPGYWTSEDLRGFGFRHVGENVQVAKNCTILGLENISLHDHSRIDGNCTITAVAGALVLGRYAHVHTSVVIGCRGGVTVGDYAGISHSCQLLSASDEFTGRWMHSGTVPPEFTNPKIAPIKVGRHVPIGVGTLVAPGVTIGDGACVLAHSIVSRDLPEWMVCTGAPARARIPASRRCRDLADELDQSLRAA